MLWFQNTLDDNDTSIDPLFMSPDNVIISYDPYDTGIEMLQY